VRFKIDPNSAVPPYYQLVQEIKWGILSGRVENGDRLPSIREMAKTLRLNPNTVAKAYYNLEDEGLLECKGRKGSYVNYDKTRSGKVGNVIAEDELKVFLDKIFYLGITEDELKKMITKQFERDHFK